MNFLHLGFAISFPPETHEKRHSSSPLKLFLSKYLDTYSSFTTSPIKRKRIAPVSFPVASVNTILKFLGKHLVGLQEKVKTSQARSSLAPTVLSHIDPVGYRKMRMAMCPEIFLPKAVY